MRNSPLNVVDPARLDVGERNKLRKVADAAMSSGQLDLEDLPRAVRDQLLFAIDAYGRGESVAAVIAGHALTSTEAAKLLGMSRTHLTRLCNEGRIASFAVGTALRIPPDEIRRILTERADATAKARDAAATADQRRRNRAARAAGLS